MIPAPFLQIVAAMAGMDKIDANLEALLFGICSMATFSMAAADFPNAHGPSKEDVLAKYQFGCQQALVKARFPLFASTRVMRSNKVARLQLHAVRKAERTRLHPYLR